MGLLEMLNRLKSNQKYVLRWTPFWTVLSDSGRVERRWCRRAAHHDLDVELFTDGGSDRFVLLDDHVVVAFGAETFANVGFEISRRGEKKSGLIQETLVAMRIGLSLNDIWFIKRKYN